MTGGVDSNSEISDNTLEWDSTTNSWKEMPSLKIRMANHAVSVIDNFDDVSNFCTWALSVFVLTYLTVSLYKNKNHFNTKFCLHD